MSTIAVLYATKTGHSQKLARAIGEAVGVEARNVTECAVPENVELIFLIGGIYGGKSLPELVHFAESLKSVQKAVLVTSSVSVGKRMQADIRKILTEKGIAVLDEITCTGSLLFIKPWHPNQAEIKRVAERARQIRASI